MIEAAMMKLVKTKPFFANLLMNMSRNVSSEIPTVGVNVTDRVNLWINPFFWESLSLEEQVDILIHECLHVLNNHFVRFKDLDPTIFEAVSGETVGDKVVNSLKQQGRFRFLNAAADYAINEYLPNLPKTFKAFDKDGKAILGKDGKPEEMRPCLVSDNKGWPRYKHLELYYDLMKKDSSSEDGDCKEDGGKKRKKKGQSNDGHGHPIDDHSLWAKGEQDDEVVLEKIKQAVNKAVESSGGIDSGNIPSDVRESISKLFHKPKDWRGDLQRFVARSSEVLIESSRKVRNRRYGIIYAGNKTYPKLKLVVVLDTSGSIENDSIAQFLTEVDKIHKTGADITIIECDAEVKQVGPFDPKKSYEVKGRGGTDFAPAFEKAKEYDPDALIYFTDGEDFGSGLKKPSFPVLWALLPKCKVRYNWGARTEVKINKSA